MATAWAALFVTLAIAIFVGESTCDSQGESGGGRCHGFEEFAHENGELGLLSAVVGVIGYFGIRRFEEERAPLKAAPPPADGKPPPGWYDNPEAPGKRYWDGEKWTDSYAPP